MLIKNIAQVRLRLGGVQTSMEFSSWEAFLEEAELFYVEPAVGSELLVELDGKVNNDNDDDVSIDGTDKEKKLIKMLQMAYMAYASFMGTMRQVITTGDAGKMVQSPQNMQAVSKWATVASMKVDLRRGDDTLEKALIYIEKNAADFGSWKGSAHVSARGKLLVNSAARLTEYFPFCNGSRRMYLALEAEIAKSQNSLKTQMGTIIYDAMIAENVKLLKGDAVNADYKGLIEVAAKYVSLKSVFERVTFLNIDEDWHLWSQTEGIENKDVLKAERRAELKAMIGIDAEAAWNGVVDYLNAKATASVFADYFNSERYTEPSRDKVTGILPGRIANDPTKPYGVI